MERDIAELKKEKRTVREKRDAVKREKEGLERAYRKKRADIVEKSMRLSVVRNSEYVDTVDPYSEYKNMENELDSSSVWRGKWDTVVHPDDFASNEYGVLILPENEQFSSRIRKHYPRPSNALRNKIKKGAVVYVHADAQACREFLRAFGANISNFNRGSEYYGTHDVPRDDPVFGGLTMRFGNGTFAFKRGDLPSHAVHLVQKNGRELFSYWTYGEGMVVLDAYDMFDGGIRRRDTYDRLNKPLKRFIAHKLG